MRVTGAEGKAGTLAIAVNVPGQVLVSPSTLSFSNTGAGDSQSVTVTQTGNSAAFKADASSCRSKGVATVQAGSYAGGSQSFQVTPTAVGSCLVTFTGSGGQQGTLAITVLPHTRVGPFSFTYSYGAGGELQEEQFIMAADAQVGTTSMSYAYTPAGRLLQHSETAPGGAAMVSKDTYDGYGRLQNQNFPDGNGLRQMEYDPAGELLGQVMSMSKGGPYTQTWTYDSLGELVASDPGTAGLYGASVSYYADGVQVFSTSRALRMTGAPSGISATWDARMGAAISSSYEYGEVVGKNTTSLVTAQTSASYDAVGRSLASTSQSVTMNAPTSLPSGSTVTRTYDVENHLVSADGVGFPKAPPAGDTPVPHSIYTTYAWGVNGHPIRIGTGPDPTTGTTGFDTLIWDGGAPLYTMRHGASADTLDDVKLGTAGELTPTDPGYSGLTFYDRGHDGGVLFAHNVTGAQLLEAGNPWAIPLTVCGSWPVPSAGSSVPLNVQWTAYNGAMCPGPTVPTIGNGATIGMLRTDGISDGVSTIQGTRAYDPTTSQWTTPDAFAGAVDDPGSQKAYSWDGNNPVAYGDPSGYDSQATSQGTDGGGATSTSNAGAPGSACAATDAAGDCFQQNEDITPPPGTKTSGYNTLSAAAKAAADAYSFLDTKGEVGCAVYCKGSNCGFGDATVTRDAGGGTASLGVDMAPTVSASQTGIWHRHPPGDPEDFTQGHTGNAADVFFSRPDLGELSIYTTEANGPMWVQQYTRAEASEGDIVEPSQVP